MFSRNVFTPAARASRHVAGALAAAIVAAFAAPSLGAQSLYVPRTMKKAYANGTRALDGTFRSLFERWYPGLANGNADGAAQAVAA